MKRLFWLIYVVGVVAPIDLHTLTPELTAKQQAIEDTKCFPDRRIQITTIQARMPDLVLLQADIDRGYMSYRDFTILAYEYIYPLYDKDIFGQEDPVKVRLGNKYFSWIEKDQVRIIQEIAKTDPSIHYRADTPEGQALTRADIQEACNEMQQDQREFMERVAARQAESDRLDAARPRPSIFPGLTDFVELGRAGVDTACHLYQQISEIRSSIEAASGSASTTMTPVAQSAVNLNRSNT